MSIIQGTAKATAVDDSFFPFGISSSLRFDGSSTLKKAYGSTTISTYTVSVWFKRSNLSFSGNGYIFSEHDTAGLLFATSYPDIRYYDGSSTHTTSPALRDTSAWYHVVFSVNGTAGNLYLNGGSTPILTVSSATPWGHSTGMYFGSWNESHFEFEGYMAEINFVDGTALTPTSFGETKNGVWIPKNPSGLSYGTNGFRLNFSDATSLTTLGYDSSLDSSGNPNNNHWTLV